MLFYKYFILNDLQNSHRIVLKKTAPSGAEKKIQRILFCRSLMHFDALRRQVHGDSGMIFARESGSCAHYLDPNYSQNIIKYIFVINLDVVNNRAFDLSGGLGRGQLAMVPPVGVRALWRCVLIRCNDGAAQPWVRIHLLVLPRRLHGSSLRRQGIFRYGCSCSHQRRRGTSSGH